MLTNKPNTDNNGLAIRANGLDQNELGPFAKVMVLLRAFASKTKRRHNDVPYTTEFRVLTTI